MSKLWFFEIFLDTLRKMKDNLGQERVEKGIEVSFQVKNWNNSPDIRGKMTIFPVLTLLFQPFLPKIWHSHPNKNYIFEISNNRASR